jgi:hypothetical protein
VGTPAEGRFRVTKPVASISGALSISLANPDFVVVPSEVEFRPRATGAVKNANECG